MIGSVDSLMDNRDGATSIEYALIGAFMTVAIAAAFPAVGAEITALFDAIAQVFANAS